MRWIRPTAVVTMIAMTMLTNVSPLFVAPLKAQQAAPVSQGFNIDAGDLRFIYDQILVAQAHAAGGTLFGPGPLQVSDPQLPKGLRTVDGTFNNIVPGQEHFGAADLPFPRLTSKNFRAAETLTFDPDGPGGQANNSATSYGQKKGSVSDSQPRLISNLIVDQSASNPAAVAAAHNPCGAGGFVCGGGSDPDPLDVFHTQTLFIPNITPDFGLSAPFNLMFAFFGQFFDHGLDLVTKGGGTVFIPLKADDPLIAGNDHLFGTPDDLPVGQRFMAVTRATNLPGPDGVLGDNPATPQDESADDVQDGMNTTTPWVDQNQTYTSHPSHQVFLRQYALVGGRARQTGKVADGGSCAPRFTGIAGDEICDIANWKEVKAQAATMLGIQLTDADIFDVPLVKTDPYGHFIPGTARGMAQLVLADGSLLEGNTAGGGTLVPVNARRTGHAFLNDIAHAAVPTFSSPGVLNPDTNLVAGHSLDATVPTGSYDDELLDLHFVTGDGRGNENIGLTAMHNIFHSEHNRLVVDIDRQINALLTPQEIANWHGVDSGSGWDYGERLFQAARFCTEMQYQHLVFEEFARKVQPLINPFLGGITSINGVISAEFAHTVYRLGHSMLPEVVARTNADGSDNGIRLFDAFLNPASFNDGGSAGPLTADKAVGSLVRGLSQEVANELDEFVSSSVRNTLVGLPLDLPAINIARGRSEGVQTLNVARAEFYARTRDAAVAPYANWFEFGQNLKHPESLVNFVAAYGTDPTITSVSTVAAKRAAADTLVSQNGAFMFNPAASTGVDDVDFWVGGLAERQAVFGGLLGSTFNFVFEKQLESLQDGDRFYYLQRTDGLNLRFQLEGNSLAELIRRNSDFAGGMDIIFNTADANLTAGSADFTNPASSVPLGDNTFLQTRPDGTKVFFDPQHRGKNIVFNGGPGVDKFQGDIGDDTLYGNGSADRLDGFEGNDTLHGGQGDDVLFGGNGDDVIKGGDGADAMNSGPGFGGDLLIGGEGNDFIVAGNDGAEHFGGGGDDIIIDGATRTEGAFGGTGDDWIDGGDGHDGGLFGDNGNAFDLLAGLEKIGGDDVIDGGPGQDGYLGEGGDDIFLQSEGSNKIFGDYGFDWITQRAWPFAADIELFLLALPNVPLNFNDLRNKYRFVDGASGWDLDDHIRGSRSILCDPAGGGDVVECLIPGMELTKAGADKITGAVTNGVQGPGLTQLMGPGFFNQPLVGNAIPGIKGEGFMGGNILMGGRGSDVLEGKEGDDLIDGDRWLNVQLRAEMVDGTVKFANNAIELQDDVFANPQRLNPGKISIVRTIVTPVVPRRDCGAAVPLNCDTAVFNNPLSEFSITFNPVTRAVVVTHVPATLAGGAVNVSDGVDTLLNIEQLRFTNLDGTTETIPNVIFSDSAVSSAVPPVVGLTQAEATAALAGADFVAVPVVGTSTTAPVGSVILQAPAAGSLQAFHSNVTITVTQGTTVPSVVGNTQTVATTAILARGLVVGAVTSVNNAAAAGTVISQSPVNATIVPPGSGVALTVSLGPGLRTVPPVLNLTQAAATTAIQTAGLTLGTVTTEASATVLLGNAIRTSPVAGSTLAPGSAVGLVVSSGAAQPLGLVVALGFDEAAGATAINSVNAAFNGTIRSALRVPGRFGNALSFNGSNSWVTITDSTVAASPLKLTTGMTLEAWVNPANMSGWETILMKERGITGEGLLSYALYAHDGAPLAGGTPRPGGYIRTAPAASTTDRGVRGATTLALNTWTHIAVTYTNAAGGTMQFYINGAPSGAPVTGTGLIANTNGAIRIGGNNSSLNEFFSGLIDEVRVYNRALSAAEITTDMNAAIVR